MDELKSALRETLRTTVIALIPLLITQLESSSIDWKVLGMALVIGLLRGIDKWLKATENPASRLLSFSMIK